MFSIFSHNETQYDWRFRIFNIPFRVTPWFWLTCALLYFVPDPQGLVIAVAAVFLAFVVHELGHAFAKQYYGIRPQVVLAGFGGHTSDEGEWTGRRKFRLSNFDEIVISAAGPLAGLALAGVAYIIIYGPNAPGNPIVRLEKLHPVVISFVSYTLYINLWLSIFNLFPILPLDGGRIMLSLMRMTIGYKAETYARWVSIAVAIVVAFAFPMVGPYGQVMLAMLAYQNYVELQMMSRW